MTKETKDILNKAISDVGFWRWWDQDEPSGDYMVEFGGVLLYDDSKRGKSARTSAIALCSWENSFLIFLDNDAEPNWYLTLKDDLMEPPVMDPGELIFDNKEKALELLSGFKRRHGDFSSREEDIETIKNAKEIVTGTCGDYGFIMGGDSFTVYGSKGDMTEEQIKIASEKWWEYWKDYWQKRGTDKAYKEDYACEVTIPCKL